MQGTFVMYICIVYDTPHSLLLEIPLWGYQIFFPTAFSGVPVAIGKETPDLGGILQEHAYIKYFTSSHISQGLGHFLSKNSLKNIFCKSKNDERNIRYRADILVTLNRGHPL